ncbi:MAG TPA: hypothetical protein VHO90_17130, partial [Bacteroidales bacterium]|nr:hypothetical protein [Bacteroidales bacterium]
MKTGEKPLNLVSIFPGEAQFYVLYDKIREPRFLKEAYKRVKANAGSPGVDGVTFEAIEKDGIEAF